MNGSSELRRLLREQLESLQRAGVTDLPVVEETKKKELPVEKKLPAVEEANEIQGESDSMEESKPTLLSDRDRSQALADLAEETARCTACPELVENRTQTVFGVGSPTARLVFVGEAPGADEDRQGVPFVGRAGKLLTDMIQKGMGLSRDEVYICNILRCRPPGNRNPAPLEAARCQRFLLGTLEVIAPEFICCLGTVAAQYLLETTETIGRMRGEVHRFGEVKVVCTYHPAYLLRNPPAKAKSWQDLQLLMREMGLPIPKKGSSSTT
jgi:DNA polymerase